MENTNKIQENNEEIKSKLFEEATQHMLNENDRAIKSKLKRITENQCKAERNAVVVKTEASTSENGIGTKRRLVGIKRKHDEIDDNQKDTADRQIIIMGGVSANSNALSSVTIFNSVYRTYSHEIPSMNHRREAAASCVYRNDIIITGGWDGVYGLDTIEILKINQHPPRWTIFEGFLRFRLSSHVLIVYQEKLLVIGGYNWDRQEISNEIYELPLTPPDLLTLAARMPQPRNMHRAEIVNGNLFILGGRSTNNPEDGLGSVIRYDPTSNEFLECASLPSPVSDMSTVIWGNKIIVVGSAGRI